MSIHWKWSPPVKMNWLALDFILLLMLGAQCRAGVAASKDHLTSVHLTTETEFIEQWYTCGPFKRQGSPELLKRWVAGAISQPITAKSFFQETYVVKTGKEGWSLQNIVSIPMASADPVTKKIRPLPTRIINFQALYPNHVVDSSAYALAFVDSSTSQTRTLLMGSDDGLKVWLNGRIIHEVRQERPIVPDVDFAIARFRPGRNILLVEVENAKGYWGFMLRMHSSKAKMPLMRIPDMGELVK